VHCFTALPQPLTVTAMRHLLRSAVLASIFTCAVSASDSEWVPLFDGHSLEGWRASENQGTFRVVDGVLVAHGRRSHLFYVGPVQNASFENFELRAEVLTKPGANSGIYFHTEYQQAGWPDKGYEIQINNSHSDWRRTGSLYAIEDNRTAPVGDDTWFTLHIRVEGKRIVARVNERVIVDYTEPENPDRPGRMAGRVLGRGTIAIQGHDPASEVHFRKVEIRPLH
jgi:hypothetical protein